MIHIQPNSIGSSSCLRNVGSRVSLNSLSPVSRVGNVRCQAGSGSGSGSISGSNSDESSFKALEGLKTSADGRYTKEKSGFMVVGLSFHTAPVEIREKLSIPEAELPQAITELCGFNHIEEAAVLSTCNRMEIYAVALAQHPGVKEITEWMSKVSGVSVSDIRRHQFLLYEREATRHLFEVSSGLDSIVLGEGQILSQVKHVVKVGEGVQGFDMKISGLFKCAIKAGKRVRSKTNISSGSVSVSSAAVELAQMKLPEHSYSSVDVLVVGAGKMGKLVIKHLVAKGCTKMVVVNRSEDRVSAIRDEFKDIEIVYQPFTDLMSCASNSDVVFTCTASETLLFTKEQVETLSNRPTQRMFIDISVPRNVESCVSDLKTASKTLSCASNPDTVFTCTASETLLFTKEQVETLSNRPTQRMFIDISVPRNVESCVSDLKKASVYNVDDLKEVVEANKKDRLRKAEEAQIIISHELREFEAWKDSLETLPTIKKLWAHGQRVRASEFEKCLTIIGPEIPKKTQKAINESCKGIVNELLHGPMQHLRPDETKGRFLDQIIENMHVVNRIFGLEP